MNNTNHKIIYNNKYKYINKYFILRQLRMKWLPILPSQGLMFLKLLDSSDLGVKVEFAEGGKPEYPEKNPQSQIEINKS